MKFVRKSLRNKLILTLLSVSIGSIAVVGYMSFFNARNSLQNAMMNAMKANVDLKTQTIELFFQERTNDIKAAQNFFNIKINLPIMSKHAGDRTSSEYIAAKNMLDDHLKAFQKAYGYADIMLVNPEGIIVYASNEAHEKEMLDKTLPDLSGMAFEEGKKRIYISDIFALRGETGNYEMSVTAPVYDFDGKFAGVISFEIDLDTIHAIIQDRTGLGETGETLIGKKIGNVID